MWCTFDLIHILPPVTAEGYDGSHRPRYVECTQCRSNGPLQIRCLRPFRPEPNTLCVTTNVRSIDLHNVIDLIFTYFTVTFKVRHV